MSLFNVNIKGISVDNNEIKIGQYADDTTLILDGSREALASALNLLEDFSKVSGLRLNNKIKVAMSHSTWKMYRFINSDNFDATDLRF